MKKEIWVGYKVDSIVMDALIKSCAVLERLREEYFPWGAGNNSMAVENTKGEIRLRSWATRTEKSPLHGLQWETPNVGTSGGVRQQLEDAARLRELVKLTKGGACWEHAQVTAHLLLNLDYGSSDYGYLHRMSWDNGSHEYVVVGRAAKGARSSMKNYIMIDPWTASPQVCLFQHSSWFDDYKYPERYRYSVNLRGPIPTWRYRRQNVNKARYKQELLKAIKAAKEEYAAKQPMTWECARAKCRKRYTNLAVRQALVLKCLGCKTVWGTKKIQGSDKVERLKQSRTTFRKVYKDEIKRIVPNTETTDYTNMLNIMKLPEKYAKKINWNNLRKEYYQNYKASYKEEPILMPLCYDPEDPYIKTRTPNIKFVEKEGERVRVVGRPKVTTRLAAGVIMERIGVPITYDQTMMWGEERWGNYEVTKGPRGHKAQRGVNDTTPRSRITFLDKKGKKMVYRVYYYDGALLSVERAREFWKEHVEKCKIKTDYKPLLK